MIKFIEDNNFKSRNVALYGTSGSGKGIEVEGMENILNMTKLVPRVNSTARRRFCLLTVEDYVMKTIKRKSLQSDLIYNLN